MMNITLLKHQLLKLKIQIKPKSFYQNYDGKKIPFENYFFDRIIISHCLEYIYYPEEFLEEVMSKLRQGGVLSISLPTDPGFLFRLGRLYMRFFSIKKIIISRQ